MLPLGPCGWHILRSIYSEEILMIRRKYITICNPSPSPFVRIKEGDCFLSRLCLCWSPIWVLNCWEGEDEQKTVRAEWMCKSRECVWSVQVRNLPQPSFPAEHSLYMRVRECAWGYSQRALVQLVRFVSRSWLKRRGNSENITKRTFFSLSPQTRRESRFLDIGRLKKAVRRNGHLAIQSLVRTVIGSEVIVMMLTKENTMKKEKLWDLWVYIVWDTRRGWIYAHFCWHWKHFLWSLPQKFLLQ